MTAAGMMTPAEELCQEIAGRGRCERVRHAVLLCVAV